MSLLFDQTFAYADATDITTEAPAVGSMLQSLSSTLYVKDNRAANWFGGFPRVGTNQVFASADLYVRASARLRGSAGSFLWVIARGVDANNFYALQIYQDAPTFIVSIIKVVSGEAADLTSQIEMVLALDTDYTCDFVVNGSALEGFVNGASIVSVTDATFTAAGLQGLSIGGSTTSSTTGFGVNRLSVADAPFDGGGGGGSSYFARVHASRIHKYY